MVIQEDKAPPRATRREWIGLAVVCIACVLYVMDLTVLHLAVPAITEDLNPSSTQLLWIIDIYGFLVAGSLITMGALGDRIGRRRLLMIGASAFGVASVLAAFSTSAEMLIATRALLGVAGATLAPSTLSLVRNMFLDPKQRTRAIGIWITSFSLGGAIGPLLGGVVLEFFWWGAVFLLALPVMAILLILGPRLLPEYRDPNAGRPDLPSAALSLGAVLAAIYGIKQIAQDGMSVTAVAAILLGIAIGVIFVRRQQTLDDPFLDIKLFRVPSFSVSLAVYGVGILLVFGGFLLIPQYLQLVVGLSPFEAGLWTLPEAVAFIIGTNVTPNLSRRVRPATLMAGGLFFAAIGFALFTQIEVDSSLWLIVTGSIIFALGSSPLFTLTNDLIIGSVPPEKAGAAAGMSETSAEFGGAVGIAIFGSVGVAIYRSQMEGVSDLGIASAAADEARNTLGGALEVASELPARIGGRLVETAQEAFTSGVQTVAALCVAGSLVLAMLVMAKLRDLRPSGESEEEAGPGAGPGDSRSPVPAES